jgi:alpha-L-arabinofuranosidase
MKRSTQAGLFVAAGAMGSRFGIAQSRTTTRVIVDSERQIAPIGHNLFGSFLEQLGRAIYEGIYDPGSKFADANGFRTDVLKEIRELGVPIVRWPGGNFVSGYHWLDGVGPKDKRPTVLDKAWDTIETNQFGTNEFMTWAKLAGVEPLMGLNFGTGSAEDAAALVEYCNLAGGTKWSDLRRAHGYEKPHNVKYWCVGNEMDGTWQIGHMPAKEYGLKAADAARQMRNVDPRIQLIACGSSGPFQPTYIDWDRTVLEECYDTVDGISLHHYWGNTEENFKDTQTYLAMNLAMDRQIREIVAVCDTVKAQKRSDKQLFLSFDEWNVWYRARSGDALDGRGKKAPHLLEEPYNLEDALLIGGLANSLIRNADRVKVACLAQLVNVIAPIMTNENGTLRHSIYYPYAWALKYGRGNSLNIATEGPGYEVNKLGPPFETNGVIEPGFGEVAFVDISAAHDKENKTVTLFLLNRDVNKAQTVEIVWRDLTPTAVNTFQTMTGPDVKAGNTFADPNRVKPQTLASPKVGSRMTIELPAKSYSVLSLAV